MKLLVLFLAALNGGKDSLGFLLLLLETYKAAAAVARTAAAVATHDGFPSGAAARPISGILNNIPQQWLLWVSIYIQNAV